MSAPRPPRVARWCLQAMLHPEDRECALSDLAEEFERRCQRDGARPARRWYRSQARHSMWPALSRRASLADAAATEARWAWRGLRSRQWRGVVIVALMGCALAANAIVFSAADAFVFRPVPYRDPGSLAIIERVGRRPSDYIWPAAFREWRRQTDLFSSVQAHASGDFDYITIAGITEIVSADRVTPGMLELLGVLPKWGRPFTNADASSGTSPVVIAGETLARRLFGDPSLAVGRTISTGSETLTIVGVMPGYFRFPTAREQLWKPLDLSKWNDRSGLENVVRLAPERTIQTAAAAVADRTGVVERAVVNHSADEHMRLRSMADVRSNAGARALFAMLAGAAACLLLIACANVASLEMAAATSRRRVYAIQTALGASRASLIRVGLIEGAALLGGGAAVGVLLSVWGTDLLDQQLTPAMRDALANPIDVDPRLLAFMIAIATATWLITSLPTVWQVSRASVVDNLRDDARTMPVTRTTTRSRQILMAAQVALTTMLLVGALLYVRSYVARVGLDKGFDSSNLATIVVSRAPDAPGTDAAVEADILTRLRATPGVRSIARTSSLPPSTQSGGDSHLAIDGRPETPERVMLHVDSVDPEYFSTMGIQLIEGRAFDASTPRDQVVVDERLARMYWPDGSALGARFHIANVSLAGVTNFQIAGISRERQSDRIRTEEGDEVFLLYARTSEKSHPLTFVARLDAGRRPEDLSSIVRSLAPRSIVRLDTVSARYARLAADTRLAAAVTTGFGVLAFLIAVSGIYAVMTFLVAGRSREIAIRMALGADAAGILRLTLGSSARFVAVGTAGGLAAAVAASRWLSAQLFDVTPTDPATYTFVALLMMATALAATWRPARRASRVDPARTLAAQ